jgi:hypothetical protein
MNTVYFPFSYFLPFRFHLREEILRYFFPNNLKLTDRNHTLQMFSCALIDYVLQMCCVHYQKQNQIAKYGSTLKVTYFDIHVTRLMMI